MPLLGVEASASGVARAYADLCNVFVLDERDRDAAPEVAEMGPRPLVLDTIMSDLDASARLASDILAEVGS
jgi:hypothetical protein